MYDERIKKIRITLGLSTIKMAEKLGIPSRTLGGYERGERTPSIELLAQLYKVFNININWFVSGEGEMINPPKYDDIEDKINQQVESLLKKHKLI